MTAEHAVALLDDGGVEQAHVVGLSFGGVIAQGLPILHPQREQDRVLPRDNGRLLADCIPGARLLALAAGGHAVPTDVPGASRELVSFLLAQSRRPAHRATRNGRAARA